MNYLKSILFVAIVNGYVLFTKAEKIPFSSLSYTTLKELCGNQYIQYNLLIDAGKLSRELINNYGNCTDTTHQDKIKKLVEYILPCFDNETTPNENELTQIYSNITEKLCINYEIVNFLENNKKCIKSDNEEFMKCLSKNVDENKLESDNFYQMLALTLSKTDCNFFKNMYNCIVNSFNDNCKSEAKIFKIILSKFALNLKCAK
ncbi:uncharacterized protein LOC127286330 [Leptopilina boulardi]|uniref:uncharacterized protein LOC127286330 n=1 Tax=Leptopilina boulardi TaxID=63433 RepID=UPI0021F5D478|nr:uncharacterized protein LOC127286330 [Leptopilina boulardi]